jgi:A/G-specific adenine glycosylase
MELGALVCRPKKMLCHQCPLQLNCFAFKNNCTEELPFKSKKLKVPHYHIAVGVIVYKNRVLIRRRPEHKMLGGLWEFPGDNYSVKTSTFKAKLSSELSKEFNQTLYFKHQLSIIKHQFSHFKISLHPYIFTVHNLFPIKKPYQWSFFNNLDEFPFPTANKKIIVAYKKLFK